MSQGGWPSRGAQATQRALTAGDDPYGARKRYANDYDSERDKRYRMNDDRRYGHDAYPRYDRSRRDPRGARDGRRQESSQFRVSPPPEGTTRLSERPRKLKLWDECAIGFEDTDALSAKVTGLFGTSANARGTTTGPTMPAGDATDVEAAAALYNAAIFRHSRRLHVTGVSSAMSEGGLRNFINARMTTNRLGVTGGYEPCLSAEMHTSDADETPHAYLEFRDPQETTNALTLDGAVYESHRLSLRRPKDYAGLEDGIPDSANKLYIGGIPTFLTEDQVMELLRAFGELRGFHLVRDSVTMQSKGYGFCEYDDPATTELAIQGLNDMEVGDSRLEVKRASSGPAIADEAEVQETSDEPTRAMTMLNMVTPEELLDDQEYDDIVEDVRDECSKHGIVQDIRIPRPARESKGAAARSWQEQMSSLASDAPRKERYGVGRVYVMFNEISQCASALRAIAGRQFGGRMVICAFLREEAWPAEEDGSGERKLLEGPA